MIVMTRENEKLVAMPRRKISPKAKEINRWRDERRTQSECSPSKHNLPGTNTSCRVDAEDEDETASSKEDSGGIFCFICLLGKGVFALCGFY
jgi:hypothetical protein